ncbi:hypothetical protein BH10PSE2_BH10PSE2_15700 [soil metagenome]
MTAIPHDDFINRNLYEGIEIPLASLFRQRVNSGQSIIQGTAFRRCRIEGPAVMLVLDGVVFTDCDMGDNGGDIRNMLVRPMAQKVIGAVPVAMSVFENCTFHAVGFTGTDQFLDIFQSSLGVASMGRPS